jgi:iron complex transport system substrate-binding protein
LSSNRACRTCFQLAQASLGRLFRAKARNHILAILVLAAAAWCAPRRIVCLSPNLTEIVYGVGAFDQVVGVSKFASYPPQVSKLPTLGGWLDPDYEKMVALRPDLVMVDQGLAQFVADKCRQLGLHVLVVKDEKVADVYTAIAAVGQATGHEAEAARLLQTTREGLGRVSQKTAALPKPKVVLIVDRTPGTLRDLYTATAGSYLAELVELAGGRVAVPPDKLGYAKLSKEDLLAADPDVILDFTHGAVGRFTGDPMEAWREMPELKAVRTHRVYEVNQDYVPHASQRMVQTAGLFARLIHPEVK